MSKKPESQTKQFMSKRTRRIYNDLDNEDIELIKRMSKYICSFVEGKKEEDVENVEINKIYARGLIPTFQYKYETNFEIDVMDIERLITLGLFQFKFKPEIVMPKDEAHYMIVSDKIYKMWPRENTGLVFIHLTKEGSEVFGLPDYVNEPNAEAYYRNNISYFQSLRFDEIGKYNKK